MFSEVAESIIELKENIFGFTVKRKYRNRKWKKYHKKGILDIVADDPFLTTGVCSAGIHAMRNILKRKEREDVKI